MRPEVPLMLSRLAVLALCSLLFVACDADAAAEVAHPEPQAPQPAAPAIEQTNVAADSDGHDDVEGVETFPYEIYVDNLKEVDSCDAREVAFNLWMNDLPQTCSEDADCTKIGTLWCPIPVNRHTRGIDAVTEQRDSIWLACGKRWDTISCKRGKLKCITGRCETTR